MKSRSVIAVSAATLLAAGVISASTATASHSPHKAPVFTLTAKQTTGTFLDLNKKGQQGDEFVFTEGLFFKGQGQVGHDAGVCTLMNKNTAQCVVTATFPGTGGSPSFSLTVQGATDQRHAADVLSVTGGTGTFEGVSGAVETVSLSNNKTRLIFDLVNVPVTKAPLFK